MPAELQVERWSGMTDDDMEDTLEVFRGLGIEAEEVPESHVEESAAEWAQWVQYVHRHVPPGVLLDMLKDAGQELWKRYRERNRTPPRAILVLDADGKPIGTITVTDAASP